MPLTAQERLKRATKRQARWRHENVERARANGRRRQARYVARHPARVKEQLKKSRTKHAERIRKYKRTPAVLDQACEYGKRRRQTDPAVKINARRWKQANKCKVCGYTSKRRALKMGAVGAHTAADVVKQFVAQKGRCYYCEVPLLKYHVEHKIPLVRGGSNGPENIVCSCGPCNLSKGRLTDDEFRIKRARKKAA